MRITVQSWDGCCGGKFCKPEWKELAIERCETLLVQMGDGWRGNVWENLGWHYEVRKGHVRITTHHYKDEDAYTAWIEVPGVEQIIERANDPNDALGFAVQKARGMILRLENALTELSDIVGPT